MQTDDVRPHLIQQINQFLTYTADTDNDTIFAQYTVIEGLITQLIANHNFNDDSFKVSFEKVNNADYDYFLNVNTLNPQPIQRKGFALEGLQERIRDVLKQLSA